MIQLFTSDTDFTHLAESPWSTAAHCGAATGSTPVPDSDPSDLCWTCAFEWADRELAETIRVSEASLQTIFLIDQLVAAGHPELVEETLEGISVTDPAVFAEVAALRNR